MTSSPEESIIHISPRHVSVNSSVTSSAPTFTTSIVAWSISSPPNIPSLSFDNRISILMIIIIIALQIGTQIFDGGVLSVIISSCILIGLMPYLEVKINSKIGSGQGRSVALGVSILIGIVFIFILTYFSISNVERIGSGNGAIAVSLWLTSAITGIGLIGMLLPLLGFDSHPRPEAWGWRTGLMISPMLLTIQSDLASHVMLGVLIALVVSVSSPLVLEKRPAKAV